MVQEELTAPDLRYAVLVVLISALFLRWLWQRLAHRSTAFVRAEPAVDSRVLAALAFCTRAAFLVAFTAPEVARDLAAEAVWTGFEAIGVFFRICSTQKSRF